MTVMGEKTITESEPENKFPECLYLKIWAEPVASKSQGGIFSRKKSEPEVVNLFLLINFNEQWVDFSFGRVNFGLQGGELRLDLKGGRMPLELRNKDLKKILVREYDVEYVSGREEEGNSQFEVSLTPELPKSGMKRVRGKRVKISTSNKFQLKEAQISHKGADHKPVWVFKNKTGEPILIGELEDLLGQMLIDEIPCTVKAEFLTEDQVVLSGLKDKSGDNIYDKGWLNYFERVVAKKFLNSLVKSPLSQQVLHYGK